MKNLVALLTFFVTVSNAWGSVTLPYSYSAGQSVDASKINANEGALRDELNDHESQVNGHNTPLSSILSVGNSCGASSIDFNLNQALNMRSENLAVDPAVCNVGSKGRLVFNTAAGQLKICNGTSWYALLGPGANALVDDNSTIVDASDATKVLAFDVAGASGTQTKLITGQTANRDITFPDATGTLVLNDNTATLTGKSISGATNTFSNIPNAATTATAANTASSIMARDGSGQVAATTFTGALAGNATTATNLAADPADCGANTFATTIGPSGGLTCAAVGDAALSTSYIKADGTRALTGNWNVGAFNITATTFIGALTGNASTATALAANPAACPGGQFVTDTAADGTLTCSTPAGGGDVNGPASSVDSEFAIFSGVGGKTIKRATGTGIAMGTSGVSSFLSGATAGQVPMANGTTFVSTTLTQPYTHFNCGLSASISANTVVIDLKQSDGSTAPSASAPCIVGFRSATATSGALQSVSFTAANQVTVGASASLGHTSMTGANIYVYLVQDTTSEICVSNSPFLADDRVHSAVATPSTGGGVLYCTNTHTSRPTHLLGVIKATYGGPNWSAITSVSIAPFTGFDESAMAFSGNWQGTHTYAGGETLLIDTEEQDDFGAFFGNTYTVQIPSVCTASINAAFGSMDGVTDGSISVTVCGVGRQCFGSRTMSNGATSPVVSGCVKSRKCAAGDTITATATGDASYTLDNNGNRTQFSVECVPYAQ